MFLIIDMYIYKPHGDYLHCTFNMFALMFICNFG